MDQAALLDAYLGGPDRLRSAVAGLSREQMISRPITGRWSVLEVVCHLADTEANIAYRIKRVLSPTAQGRAAPWEAVPGCLVNHNGVPSRGCSGLRQPFQGRLRLSNTSPGCDAQPWAVG